MCITEKAKFLSFGLDLHTLGQKKNEFPICPQNPKQMDIIGNLKAKHEGTSESSKLIDSQW